MSKRSALAAQNRESMTENEGKSKSMPEPLKRQDLDNIRCIDPLCDSDHPVFVQAKCHSGAGVSAAYDKHVGCMNIYCAVCNDLVVRIQVEEATIQ